MSQHEGYAGFLVRLELQSSWHGHDDVRFRRSRGIELFQVIGNGIEGSLVAEPLEPRSGFDPIGPMARSDGGSACFALVGIFTERRFVVYESGSF
jgi:hypothetical protein